MKKGTIAEQLTDFATGRNVVLFFLIYVVMQLSMIFIVMPIWGYYSNELPLDAHFNYSAEEAYQFISSLTEHGENIYLMLGLYDTVFLVIYSIFYTLLVIFLFKKAALEKHFIYKLRFIPLFAGLFDIFENIGFHLLIRNHPSEFHFIATITNLCTILKFLWIPVTLVLLAIGLILLLLKKGAQNEKGIKNYRI